MEELLTQAELETYLWGAATILRGLVDAGDTKQVVFPLLFYKRLSDVWDEEFTGAFIETDDETSALATAGERKVRKARRKTLFDFRLHQDAELFEKAYGYLRQYC